MHMYTCMLGKDWGSPEGRWWLSWVLKEGKFEQLFKYGSEVGKSHPSRRCLKTRSRRLKNVCMQENKYVDLTCMGCLKWSRRRKWQPTQCSCLENPRDRGAWWAAVYGVAQSQTRLKRLSSSSSKIVKCVGAESGMVIASCKWVWGKRVKEKCWWKGTNFDYAWWMSNIQHADESRIILYMWNLVGG